MLSRADACSEVERVVDVPHRRAGELGELDDAFETTGAAAGIFRQQHRVLGLQSLSAMASSARDPAHRRRRWRRAAGGGSGTSWVLAPLAGRPS